MTSDLFQPLHTAQSLTLRVVSMRQMWDQSLASQLAAVQSPRLSVAALLLVPREAQISDREWQRRALGELL